VYLILDSIVETAQAADVGTAAASGISGRLYSRAASVACAGSTAVSGKCSPIPGSSSRRHATECDIPEVMERAVRMVQKAGGEYQSQWAAIESIAAKIGTHRPPKIPG